MQKIQSLFSFFQFEIQEIFRLKNHSRSMIEKDVLRLYGEMVEFVMCQIEEEFEWRTGLTIVHLRYKEPSPPVLCLPEPKIERRRRERAAEMALQEKHVMREPIGLPELNGWMW